jgi:hypothetical protein
MRIAIATHYRRLIGGTETYLNQLIPALRERGHEVAFWHERDTGPGRDLVASADLPAWGADTDGEAAACQKLADWRPDLIYANGLHEPRHEAALLQLAPGIAFLHGFNGACISGTKLHAWPVPVPCDKPFGAGCLLHYFPRRCGGLNPLTMWREYQRQNQRQALLPRYQMLLTHSDYMVRE